MSIRDKYQTTLTVDTLYEVRAMGKGVEQIAPNIEINGGTADIYVSQIDPTAGAAPTGMNIITNGADLAGSASFAFVQNYLYVKEKTPITSVVIAGVEVEVVTV